MTPHLNPHFTPVYSIDWQSLSPDNIYSIIGIFFNNLCTVAVPFFFFTAVYYFLFNTEKFDKDTYKSKIKKTDKNAISSLCVMDYYNNHSAHLVRSVQNVRT